MMKVNYNESLKIIDMIKTFNRLTLIFVFAIIANIATAQYYSGEHAFDGERHNEASASLTTGKNIITGPCIGNTLHYKHYFNNHWSTQMEPS